MDTRHPSLPFPYSHVLQGLEGCKLPFPTPRPPLLLGIWVQPRPCQREAPQERVGRQKGGGGHSPCSVVAAVWDLTDMSFCSSRTWCSFPFLVISFVNVQLGDW